MLTEFVQDANGEPEEYDYEYYDDAVPASPFVNPHDPSHRQVRELQLHWDSLMTTCFFLKLKSLMLLHIIHYQKKLDTFLRLTTVVKHLTAPNFTIYFISKITVLKQNFKKLSYIFRNFCWMVTWPVIWPSAPSPPPDLLCPACPPPLPLTGQ